MDVRLKNLRKLLTKQSLDAVFISSLPNITYLTNFSGFMKEDRDGFVLVTKDAQYIFTHGIYNEAVKKHVTNFTLVDIKRENPISSAVKNILTEKNLKRVGFEAFDLKVAEYEQLTKQIDKDIFTSIDLVGKLRIHKAAEEIAAVKKACELGDKAFDYILQKIKIGVTESELAADLDYFMKRQGADSSFPTIVAFEENAAHPHHMPTGKKLENNSFVLLDFGVLFNNYCSDMTRTVSLGKVSTEKKLLYETVHNAQQKAIDLITTAPEPVLGKDADKAARDYIISKGFPSMPHSLGHGIGLEVHESPRLTYVSEEKLEEGMVFSIEPGVYLPGTAGVRIEDLFAIKDNKLVQLTKAPDRLIEL